MPADRDRFDADRDADAELVGYRDEDTDLRRKSGCAPALVIAFALTALAIVAGWMG